MLDASSFETSMAKVRTAPKDRKGSSRLVGDSRRQELLTKLGEETFALLARGTLPIPTALRASYDALVAESSVKGS